jgi:putative NIF3 family GTP cyclohydrolase 1 type 2
MTPQSHDQPASKSHDSGSSKDSKQSVYRLEHLLSSSNLKGEYPSAAAAHNREPIKASELPGIPGAGHGRIVRFSEPQPLLNIIERIAHGVGNPKAFPIAIPQNRTMESINIQSVGICAGSGGSMFQGLDVDLLFTGELSHHEALAAIERGQVVITLFHSNTERGFLHAVMRNQLLEAAKIEWERVRSEEKGKGSVSDSVTEALDDTTVDVGVSKMDRDPYGILISKAEI